MTGSRPAQDPHGQVPPFHPHRLLLSVERADGGGLVLTSPHLPGWRRRCPPGPTALAAGVDEGWRENEVRAYANGRGEQYDLTPDPDDDGPDGDEPRPADGWQQDDDGTWLSPRGHRYRPDAQIIGLVLRRRERDTASR